MLIACRAVAGLSVAAIPLGISLVGTVLPERRAGSGIALISAMLGVGSALGLPLAGVIAEHADYHVLFWICVAGGAATLAGTVALVPEPPVSGHGRFDLRGALLLAVALAALLLPLSQAGVWGWGNVKTTGLLAAAAVLLGCSSWWNDGSPRPWSTCVVNARPALLLTNIASLAVGFALFAVLIGTANFVETPPAAGYGFGSSILVGRLLPAAVRAVHAPAFPGLGENLGAVRPQGRVGPRRGGRCGRIPCSRPPRSRTCGRSWQARRSPEQGPASPTRPCRAWSCGPRRRANWPPPTGSTPSPARPGPRSRARSAPPC